VLVSRRSAASRVLESGALAVFIVGVYGVLVVGLGRQLGFVAGVDAWLTIGATVLVAATAAPFRRRAGRFADRVVYGRRREPYAVLSDFTTYAESADLPERVARSLAEGTTAASASVWLMHRDRLVRVAVWPRAGVGPRSWQDPIRADQVGDPSVPGADLAVPVVHDGETLGVLALTAPPRRELLEADARLLAQVAGAMALALRNIRQLDELRRQVDELHASRRRIVARQDETRRRLERDLHDGAQQRLVAIKMKLGLARALAERAGSTGLVRRLVRSSDDADHVIESLRAFARSAYPPLLEAEGLRAAILDHVRDLPVRVTVHVAGIGRYARPVEAGVYACVLEALDDVVAHRGAASAEVILRANPGEVTFEVIDHGGSGRRVARHRDDLTRLADRLDALDASLSVVSSPTSGMTIRGSIPAWPLGSTP
jgi:signal transduction histidine kinase